MKKILITGISGFVGGHLCNYLITAGSPYEIYGISRTRPVWNFIEDSSSLLSRIMFHKADLMDTPKIQKIIHEIEPDYIIHLAAQSSVAESWKTPVSSFMNNTNIFLNILDAVRLSEYSTKILSVGSSEQYGVVGIEDLPLGEDRPLSPANPYAVARVAQENLARVYAKGYNMNICCSRSFNHCGPGQNSKFVVSSIVYQFVRIVKNKQDPIITIGDGSIVRDFLDIHDVISAYLLILERGKSGEVYNVCSGEGRAIRDIIVLLSDMYHFPVTIREERSQFRPIDNPWIVGTYQKINRELGWKPTISFKESLKSMYRYWSDRTDID